MKVSKTPFITGNNTVEQVEGSIIIIIITGNNLLEMTWTVQSEK